MTRIPLDQLDGPTALERARGDLVELGIADRLLAAQRRQIPRLAERRDLSLEAGLDHVVDARVDRLVERLALRRQPDQPRLVALGQRAVIVTRLVRAHRLAGQLEDLERADQPLLVV